MGAKILGIGFLHQSITAVFLISEDAADSTGRPEIVPHWRFATLFRQRSGDFCRGCALQAAFIDVRNNSCLGRLNDMKDYGYAWAGVLPAGQEAAEKALEKGCEVYRLYSDNTEGLCVDAKEIADHAAKGGMLGISKESWMAALEKENYLKAAEMSMEDDYGMIDGIINNGPKEDKTAEVKAPKPVRSPPSWTGSSLQRQKSRRNAALPKRTKGRLSCEQKSEMAAGVVVLHRRQRTPEV